MPTRAVSTQHALPMQLLSGSVLALALQLGAIANELETRVAERNGHAERSMTWTPIALNADEILYEFRLAYTPHT